MDDWKGGGRPSKTTINEGSLTATYRPTSFPRHPLLFKVVDLCRKIPYTTNRQNFRILCHKKSSKRVENPWDCLARGKSAKLFLVMQITAGGPEALLTPFYMYVESRFMPKF